MERTDIESRIQASIRPVLDKADALYEHYRPLDQQVVGKHHPMFDTFAGQMSYLKRKSREAHDWVVENLLDPVQPLPSIQGASWQP